MGNRDAEIQERAETRIGAMLRDKWHIDALIGLGGMAAVYEATHRNGKRAAIKILHAEAAMVPDIRARFLREGYLANRVGHPGAVSILDDDVDVDGTVYLVMELLEGRTLDTFRGESSVQPDELLLIAHGVLDVLSAAHKKDIVHRDLKPANVFLCTSSAIKILDFGIARLQSVAAAQSPSGATGRDVTLGTPGYMPPEQARGHWDKVDAQSDLWSLGATLFALFTGRLVHEAPTVNEQLLAAMTQPAPPLGSIAPNVPAPVAALVDRALAFEKTERWPSADAMQAEVARIYEASTGNPVDDAPPVSVARRPRSVVPDAPTVAASEHGVARTTARSTRRRRELLVVGAVGIGVVALAAFALVRGSAAPGQEAARPIEPSSASPAAEPPLTFPPPSAALSAASASVPSAPSDREALPSRAPVGAEAPDAGIKAASHRGTGLSKAASRPSASSAATSKATEPDIFVRRK
ncbi:MAG TPA: serine/threonine-protein kinase [Polyangiaceae bacterium]